MSRESKCSSTIRRKKQKLPASEFSKKSPELLNLFLNEDDINFKEDAKNLQGPYLIKSLISSQKTLFLALLAFRVVNALMIQTSFVPDEYWQSLEVAHQMEFGYGYLTWEWEQGIRGYTYPLIFSLLYKFLAFTHLDTRFLMLKLPRITQAFFASLCDLHLYKLSHRLQGAHIARYSLLFQLTSWFTFYCCTRTLTNSMETVLATIALYYYPWPGKPKKAHWKFVTFIGFSVVIRPTSAILWLPMFVHHAWNYRDVLWRIIKLYFEKTIIILIISMLIDRIFYGRWIYVVFNFMHFNVFNNIGAIYGSHPWHWYATAGIPVLLGSNLFPFVFALRKGIEKFFLFLILWTVFVYSLLEHKEFRFLFPLLPIIHHVCGTYTGLMTHHSDSTSDKNTQCLNKPAYQHKAGSPGTRARFVVLFLLVSNLPVALYTSLIHQRGTLDVMSYLSDQTYTYQRPGSTTQATQTGGESQTDVSEFSVLFLMPCHSTPYYSYLHRNVTLRFLRCDPDLRPKRPSFSRPNYIDEADTFYSNPIGWIDVFMNNTLQSLNKRQKPSHIVMFNVLESSVFSHLRNMGYRKDATFFHTHSPEGRVGSHVIVYTLQYIPITGVYASVAI